MYSQNSLASRRLQFIKMSAKDKQVKQRGNAIISSQLLDARVMDIFREAEIA